GLLDRLDVGVTIPVLHTSLSGFSVGTVIPFGPNSPHFFGDSSAPRYSDTSFANGSVTGIGDVAVRLKLNVKQSERAGLAILLDTRFATGDSANLLGRDTSPYEASVSGPRASETSRRTGI